MRVLLLICVFLGSVLTASAQPTPRPGQKIAAPVLMPKGGNQLVPSNSTETRVVAEKKADDPKAAETKQAMVPASLPVTMDEEAEEKKADKTIPVQWMTIEEAEERAKKDKKKILIDVYTDWCGWCKRMDQSTFNNPEVAAYINANYYPVKLNAEQESDINFRDKTYRFKRTGKRGYNELAAQLLANRLSYPTVVFLNEDLDVIQPLPGFQTPDKFQVILEYFGTDSHKTTPWETFERKYQTQGQN